MTNTNYKAMRETIIKRENIKVTSVFVPFSQSRNAKEKHKSLNWKVTLWLGDYCVMTTDYSAGIAHCPAYKQIIDKSKRFIMEETIHWECENGYRARPSLRWGEVYCERSTPRQEILPNPMDVLYSLVMDSDVLDYKNFEDWAWNYGYESDSRSAEKIYNDCLKLALEVRAGLGGPLLEELREAFVDY